MPAPILEDRVNLPGGAEWIIILLIFILLFGASRLPSLGRSMGQSITGFKRGMAEGREDDEKAEQERARQQLAAGEPVTPPIVAEQRTTTPDRQ